MIYKINGDRMTPPRQKPGNITRAFPYEHRADGWIKKGLVVFICPCCQSKQAIQMPDYGIMGGICFSTITRCCSRAVVVDVKGVAL
jgi:hypothetical protein